MQLVVSLIALGILLGLLFWGLRELINSLQSRWLHLALSQSFAVSEIKEGLASPLLRYLFVPEQGIQSLIPFFHQAFQQRDLAGTPYYLFLGGSGSGKSRSLLQLFIRLKMRFWSGIRPHYLSLADPESLNALVHLAHPDKTVLLIDGWDEDPLALAEKTRRLDEILHKTAGFKAVLLACEHRWFPQLMATQGPTFSFVGDQSVVNFHIVELVPLQEWQAKKWIKRHWFPAPPQLERSLELMNSPLWSRVIGLSTTKEVLQFRFQYFQAHVDLLLRSLSRKKEGQIQLHQFLEAVAGSIFSQWKMGQPLLLSTEEIEGLSKAFAIEISKVSPYFLTDLGNNGFRFRHGAYLAYFLAQAAHREELLPQVTQFEGLPLARTFFLEMGWLSYREKQTELAGYFRSKINLEKRPLTELTSEELPLINYLYLKDFRGQDLRFLRMLKQLKALHLAGANPADLKDDWHRELPHLDLKIYLGWNPQHQHIWQPEAHLVSFPLVNGTEQPTYEKRFYEIRLRQEINPLTPIAPALRQRVEAGNKQVLQLFHLDFTDLPNRDWDQVGSRLLPSGQRMETYEAHLGFLELGLFNKAELFVFEDGSYNILLHHQYRPTLMEEALQEVVRLLYQLYGEDDNHQTLFTEDDKIQLTDGIWLGRRWSWKNTDYYAYPIHLFMDEPERVNLVICGVQRESVRPTQA